MKGIDSARSALAYPSETHCLIILSGNRVAVRPPCRILKSAVFAVFAVVNKALCTPWCLRVAVVKPKLRLMVNNISG